MSATSISCRQAVLHPKLAYQPSSSPISGPTNPIRSSPVQLKKASSVGAVCGNDSSFTNIDDFSVTDGINPEHKQKQHQSPKDAGPAKRRGQRPPGALETMQANTEEVETLRLTNQRLIEELEQLTRQMQPPREAQRTQEGHNITPHEGQPHLGIPRGAKAEAESN